MAYFACTDSRTFPQSPDEVNARHFWWRYTYQKLSLPTSPPNTCDWPVCTCLERTTAQQVQIKMKTGLSNMGGEVEGEGVVVDRRQEWQGRRAGAHWPASNTNRRRNKTFSRGVITGVYASSDSVMLLRGDKGIQERGVDLWAFLGGPYLSEKLYIYLERKKSQDNLDDHWKSVRQTLKTTGLQKNKTVRLGSTSQGPFVSKGFNFSCISFVSPLVLTSSGGGAAERCW